MRDALEAIILNSNTIQWYNHRTREVCRREATALSGHSRGFRTTAGGDLQSLANGPITAGDLWTSSNERVQRHAFKTPSELTEWRSRKCRHLWPCARTPVLRRSRLFYFFGSVVACFAPPLPSTARLRAAATKIVPRFIDSNGDDIVQLVLRYDIKAKNVTLRQRGRGESKQRATVRVPVDAIVTNAAIDATRARGRWGTSPGYLQWS